MAPWLFCCKAYSIPLLRRFIIISPPWIHLPYWETLWHSSLLVEVKIVTLDMTDKKNTLSLLLTFFYCMKFQEQYQLVFFLLSLEVILFLWEVLVLLWNAENQNVQKGWRKRTKGKDFPRFIPHPTNSCQSWQETATSEHRWMQQLIFFIQSVFGPYSRICQQGCQLVPIMAGFSVLWTPIQDKLGWYYQYTLHLYLKSLCMTL